MRSKILANICKINQQKFIIIVISYIGKLT